MLITYSGGCCSVTTELIRETFKLTQKELSVIFDIPLATVKNWDSRNCLPEYIFKLMINYLITKEELRIEKNKSRVDNARKQIIFDALLNSYDKKFSSISDYVYKKR